MCEKCLPVSFRPCFESRLESFPLFLIPASPGCRFLLNDISGFPGEPGFARGLPGSENVLSSRFVSCTEEIPCIIYAVGEVTENVELVLDCYVILGLDCLLYTSDAADE